ncbi:MAG: HAD family hydrolase [Desulfurococcaceae archaeon]
MLKAVLLDLWNTLIYGEPEPIESSYTSLRLKALWRVFNSVGRVEYNELVKIYNKLYRYRGFLPPRSFIKMLAMFLNLDVDEDFVDKVIEIYESATSSYIPKPMPGTKELLEYVKKNGLKTIIVSNTSFTSRSVKEVLDNIGLGSYVDHVVSSCEIGVQKPHPLIFQTALKLANAEPEEAIHVGDSCINDAIGALLIGINPVLVSRDRESVEICSKFSRVVIVRDLEEVIHVIKRLIVNQ